MKRYILLIFSVCIFYTVFAYLPLIEHYSFQDYGGGPENWGACQNENHEIFFANQSGLLSFDGSEWKLYQNGGPENLKALYYDEADGKVYVGAKGDFGYYQKENTQDYSYHSLQTKNHIKQEKDIWKIEKLGTSIIFQSEERIYIYEKGKITELPFSGFVRSLFKIKDRLFLVDRNRGLLELKNNNLIELPGGEVFKNDQVNVILPFDDGELLISSWKHQKIYKYDFKTLREWNGGMDWLADLYPFAAIRYGDDFAIGTIDNGFYLLDAEGNTKAHLNVESGLKYNKVFGLYKDHFNNIWISYEDGIDKLSYQLPVRFVNEYIGVPGSAFNAKKIGDRVFFLATTGIYESPVSSLTSFNGKNSDFKLWHGSTGPSYWIEKIGSEFFYGNLFGLHVWDGENKKTILNQAQCKVFQNVLEHNSHYLIGFEEFLAVFNLNNKQVIIRNKQLKDLSQILYSKGKYWCLNEKNELLSFKIKETSLEFEEIMHYKNAFPVNSKPVLLNYENEVYLVTKNSVYKPEEGFKKADKINEIFVRHFGGEDFDRIFYPQLNFPDPTLHWIVQYGKDSAASNFYNNIIKSIFQNHISFASYLSNGKICIGGFGGFVIINTTTTIKPETNSKILVNKLVCFEEERKNGLEYIEENLFINTDSTKVLKANDIPYKYNNFSVNVTSTNYTMPSLNQYSFELLGEDPQVLEFSKKSEATFYNVQPGSYTLRVISKDVFDNIISRDIIKLKVLSPWYRSLWFFVTLALLLILIVVLIFHFQRKWHLSRENYLAREVETKTTELRFRNESLTSSIRYAKLIRDAHLPSQTKLSKFFRDYFILSSPKDIVGGDFCWFEASKDTLVVCVADCTGHGVPGGFMSILSINKLKNIIKRNTGDLVPSEILEDLNIEINSALNKDEEEPSMLTDGLDMGCITYHIPSEKITFAGANREIFIYSKGSFKEIKGTRRSIGDLNEKRKPFKDHEFSVEYGDILYMYSDGIVDQFGGENDKKFGKKRLHNLISETVHLSMKDQKTEIARTISLWQGLQIQTDDMILMGIKV